MKSVASDSQTREIVKLADHYDYCKDSIRALDILSPFWSGFNDQPDIEHLSDEMACRVLLVCGSVLSNHGLYAQELKYHEKAQDILTRARCLAEKLSDVNLLAEADKQIGVSYWREGRYENALVYSLAVFSHFTESECLTNEICLLTKNNLITIYVRLGEFDTALNLIKETQPFADQCNYLRVKTGFYSQTGIFYQCAGKYDEAVRYFVKTLEYAAEAKNPTYLGNTLNNLGIIYLQTKQPALAHEYINRAITLYQNKNLSANYGCALESKAAIYIFENKLQKAGAAIDESISILQRGENYPQLCESFWTRTRIWLLMGEKRLAVLQFNELLNTCQNNLSLAVTEKYIDLYNESVYLQTGGNFYHQSENYRLYLLDKALTAGGGIVNPTAEFLGISHQNTSALLKKYPELCDRHGVKLRTRKSGKKSAPAVKRAAAAEYSLNEIEITLANDRLANRGLTKGMQICFTVLPQAELNLDEPVVIRDSSGDYHCGFLVKDFGMAALGNGCGDISQTYFDGEIIEIGQVTAYYDEETDSYRPLSDLEN